MLKIDDFKNRLKNLNISDNIIDVVCTELLKNGILYELSNLKLEVLYKNFKLISPSDKDNKIATVCDFLIEVDGRPVSLYENIIKVKLPEFDLTKNEIVKVDISIIPFSLDIPLSVKKN